MLKCPGENQAAPTGQMAEHSMTVFGSGSGVSVLDVMRLQVLSNDTLHLQCAKLKVREVSGGRNRAGAYLVSQAQTFRRRPPEAPFSLSLPLSLSQAESFCKKIGPVFAQFKLLMFVNKVGRVQISSRICLCSAV